MGSCQNSIFLVFGLFLAGCLFVSSIFSESRLFTRPLFSYFVTNLDWLAGQPILWILPWGQSCGRRLYGSTTLQSRLFLKNIENFLCKKKFLNNCRIPSMHAERKIIVCSHKHSCTPYPFLSPYSQTDRMTDRETNTLAARGLEEFFFQLCCCVCFFDFRREIGFGVIYL